MTTLLSRMPKLSFDEVGAAVSSLNKLGADENLEQRKLRPEEVQQVIRFMTAVKGKQISRLLPQNAITLLRLTPALVDAKSSFTVHDAIRLGAPVVLGLMEKAPTGSAESAYYRDIMETAGRACFDPRLSATYENRRLDEFELFQPFIGQTPEYRNALAKYRIHHQVGVQNRSLMTRAQKTPER